MTTDIDNLYTTQTSVESDFVLSDFQIFRALIRGFAAPAIYYLYNKTHMRCAKITTKNSWRVSLMLHFFSVRV